jgi:hypothetical protein
VPLADPACLACLTFDDGGRPCPDHAGAYQEGMSCPACGSDILIAQHGAAFVCLACS